MKQQQVENENESSDEYETSKFKYREEEKEEESITSQEESDQDNEESSSSNRQSDSFNSDEQQFQFLSSASNTIQLQPYQFQEKLNLQNISTTDTSFNMHYLKFQERYSKQNIEIYNNFSKINSQQNFKEEKVVSKNKNQSWQNLTKCLQMTENDNYSQSLPQSNQQLLRPLLSSDQNRRATSQVIRKIKIDQAFKPFLRGIRRCLNSEYRSLQKEGNLGIHHGTHYHWPDRKIYEFVKDFLERHLFNGTEVFSDKDIWKMVAMLHPTKATIKSNKKGRKDQPTCQMLFDALGVNDIKIFRDIFKNNNQKQIKQFFNDSFIQKLWPLLRKKMKFEHCFKNCKPNDKILTTYSAIKKILQEYNVEVPLWWEMMFNSSQLQK